MENDATTKQSSTMKIHAVYICIIAILLVLIAGLFYHYHRKVESIQASLAAAGTMPPGGRMRMGMAPSSPVPQSDLQTQQLASGTAKTLTKKTFNISGGNFYFVPNKITVNKGDTVTFVLDNVGGVHDVVIDELHIKTPVIHTGESATATFTATQTGTFAFYCDVPTHRERGMVGTLIVQ